MTDRRRHHQKTTSIGDDCSSGGRRAFRTRPGTTLMSASKAFSSRGCAHPSVVQPAAGSNSARFEKPGPALKTGIGIAAMLLLLVPLITVTADARGGGGIGRGGGLGIGTRSFSGSRVGGLGGGARSLGGSRFVGRSVTSPRAGIAAARIGGTGNRFATASARNLGVAGTHLRGANLGRGVFGNRAIGNVALRSHFASARFQGRFFGSPWPWWSGGLVVGWIGPVFWPYAYYDFFDYVYWPYAYDDFWPYAYDDIYYGIYGGYAYAGGVSAPGRNGSLGPRRTARPSGGSERRAAEVCSDSATDLTDWPIERISEVVQPTDAQRPALDELRAANAKAIDILKAGCPQDLPSTPTGRLTAMESRMQVMLQAVQTVRPTLERFYQSLNDEQKARFNAVSPGDDSTAGEPLTLAAGLRTVFAVPRHLALLMRRFALADGSGAVDV